MKQDHKHSMQDTRAAQQATKQQLHHQQQREANMEATALLTSPGLTEIQKKCLSLAQEKGASSWLVVLPIERLGFSLHKGAFRDALRLRYGWDLRQV